MTTGWCQVSTLPFLSITLHLSFPKTISSVKSNLTSRQLGAARLLRCHFWQLLYFHLFRNQFHQWRATWRHDNWVLPIFSVAISGNYFNFIFSENNFIREERLDVTTTMCCQISPLAFLAITLLLSFPKTISFVKSDLTSWQPGGAKLLPCHFCQSLYIYLFWKQFHPWRATWRHDNRVLKNFSVAISSNYVTFIFSENIFIREEQLDVTTTGCCQTSPLQFLAITLLLFFPETISYVKSDLTSRQQGAAKLLAAIAGNYFSFIFSEINFILEGRLDVTTTWCCQTSTLPFLANTLLLSFPKTISSVKSDLTSWHLGAAIFRRSHLWQLLYFYLFRKQFHPWRATWRHDNYVLPNFSVAFSGNYFTFIFSENIFIREEQLDVTTTGCCQTSPLQFLAITLLLFFPKTISFMKSDLTSQQLGCCQTSTLPFPAMIFSENNFIGEERLAVTTTGWCQASTLPFLSITLHLSFPKTISSVKSNLTSRQLGAARLLRCHFWQLLYFHLFRNQFHQWRATWRHDNWVLPNFYVAISGYDLFQKQFRPWTATWRHDNWVLLNFSVAISGYDLFRKQFRPWRATWRHDNYVLPNFSVSFSGNYFTFIFSENNFIREERLDVTTTGCCQTSTLPFLAITLIYLLRKQFHPWRATWCHDNWVLPNFYVAVSGKYFTFIFSENIFIREERLDVTTTGCCQFSPLPFLAITLILSFPKTISSVKSDLTSWHLGAAIFLRSHLWQLLYFYLFRKQFHPWRATWRHDNYVLPNFSVAFSGNYFTFIFSENIFIREEQLDVTTTGCCQTSPLQFLAITLLLFFPETISYVKSDLTSRQQGAAKLLAAIAGNYFSFIFSEINFILEERLDVMTPGCCHFSPFPFVAITLLLSIPKTISSVKSDLTSRQLCAAKFLRCLFWQLLYFYLFRKQFHSWRATWRHDNWVLPIFSVAISGNYFTFIFFENNFIGEERLHVTTTGCCQTSTLLFLAITLLLSSPKTISSVKSDLMSRQLGAAKLLRCSFWQILYFYLFRKHFHPRRATWRHDNWVLPIFSVAISGNYFNFIFSENNFIREERLDVTTTGCCQISPLPFVAVILLLSFPKTISSVKSDFTSRQLGAAKLLSCHIWLWSFPKTIASVKSNLTSRQLGAARLLRCHFWQFFYFYLFRNQFHQWRATWRHDNWVLPNFYVAISGYDLFQKQFRPWTATWRHDNWVLLNFFVAISGYDLFRKQFHPWRAIWRHNNWVLPNFYVAISGYDLFRKQFHRWRATCRHDNRVVPSFYVAISVNHFTFIFSENNFIREEQLDVTTTGCCQTSTLPFLAITLLSSFPKSISSVKSDLTSRQLGAAKLLRCHFWLWSFPKTISSVNSDLTSRQLGAVKLLRCHFWLWSFPKTIPSVKSDLTSRQLCAAKFLR